MQLLMPHTPCPRSLEQDGSQSVFGVRIRAINTSADIAIATADVKRGLFSSGQGV